MGWFGMVDQMKFFLGVVGADKDPDGNYLVAGAPPIIGLDPKEIVIPDETVYFVDGKPKALAGGLASTSYGVAVKVF